MHRVLTVTTPAESYDLTDLETVKDELGIAVDDDTQDARLARYITEASAIIANICERVFAVEAATEKLFFSHSDCAHSFHLSRKPIVGILTLPTTADAVKDDLILVFDSVADITAGMPVSGAGIASGTVVDNVAEAVTLSKPIVADIPSGTEITLGFSVYENGATTTLVNGVDYQLDVLNAELFRLHAGCRVHWAPSTFIVAYSAGYDPIPPEVAGACLAVVAMLQGKRGRDPLVRSASTEGLDSVTFRDWSSSEDDVRAFIESRLVRYMPLPAFA